MDYPGDTATPKAVAKWMAEVARTQYGLPGVLPVTASCVEITDAWTAEGDVKNVPGYLWPTDHCSVGYFQQQADDLGCGFFGWGTRAQLINPPYALKRFCEEASKLKDWEWHSSTTDADALGRWAQAVQNSAFPDRYRDKGYPLASELLEGEDQGGDWPQRKVAVSKDNWAYDLDTGMWLRGTPGVKYDTDADGWIYRTSGGVIVEPEPEPKPKPWAWPIANNPPGYLGDGSYIDLHPTRYNFRPDVEVLARKVIDNFYGKVWANTYYEHPPGWGFIDVGDGWTISNVSVDFWNWNGRGYEIGHDIGQQVFDFIFNDPNPPWIRWCIWEGWIWTDGVGWQVYWDTDPFSDAGHWHHSHFTFH